MCRWNFTGKIYDKNSTRIWKSWHKIFPLSSFPFSTDYLLCWYLLIKLLSWIFSPLKLATFSPFNLVNPRLFAFQKDPFAHQQIHLFCENSFFVNVCSLVEWIAIISFINVMLVTKKHCRVDCILFFKQWIVVKSID